MHLYILLSLSLFFFFFFNDTATTEIYTLSLHDALPISPGGPSVQPVLLLQLLRKIGLGQVAEKTYLPKKLKERSEEHTSELQSLTNLVCRLLLEKKKKYLKTNHHHYDQSND